MRQKLIKISAVLTLLVSAKFALAAIGWEVVGEFYSNSSYTYKVGLGAQRCPDANGAGGDAHPSQNMVWGYATPYMKVVSKRRCSNM